MKHGSLFSGIGGFDLAAEWMGWENIFHCEWNEFGQRVLKHYWPNADSLHDITKTDFTKYEGSIDIISGGFPCQPYSAAGKRLGKEDERHLWPEMLRAIREIKPTWVVGENVRGLVNWNGGLVFDEVQSDLEAEGYEVQPFLLPAAAVNAPHRRDRVWFVAYSSRTSFTTKPERERQKCEQSRSELRNIASAVGEVKDATNPNSRGLEGSTKVGRNSIDVEWKSQFGNASDSISIGHTSCGKSAEAQGIGCRNNGEQKERSQQAEWSNGLLGLQGNATDTSSIGCNNWGDNREERHIQRNINWDASQSESEWNGRKRGIGEIGEIGATTNTANKRLEGERGAIGELERGFRPSLSGSQSNKPNAWQNFPTKPPICGGDDGIPRELDSITFSKWRNESIKAYGNAIVPQVALQIFKAIEQYENIKRGKDNN
jgi:DNA (cytosine-5)-methyltransferase 1